MSADASNLGLEAAQHSLILLVAERYFDVLVAEDTYRLAKKQVEAITNTRQEIEKKIQTWQRKPN
jgi:outer membrane protein TolC